MAVSPSGATAHVKRTILFDFVPGTMLLNVADPDHDDNGPGNYAYPTSRDFHDGAYDIQAFQVFDAGEPSSSGSGRATCRRRSAARSARNWWTSTSTIPAARVDLDGRRERVTQVRDRTRRSRGTG